MKEEIKNKVQDVSDCYKVPERITTDTGMNRREKIELLREWRYDMELQMVATEENMAAPQSKESGETIRQIDKALSKLGVEVDGEKSSPGKTMSGDVKPKES